MHSSDTEASKLAERERQHPRPRPGAEPVNLDPARPAIPRWVTTTAFAVPVDPDVYIT